VTQQGCLSAAADSHHDEDFATLNLKLAQNALDQIREELQSYAPEGELTFIELPALFFVNRNIATTEDFLVSRSMEAFNPGPTNLQEVSNQLFVARQFGPRDKTGRDIFEQAIRSAFDSIPTANTDADVAESMRSADPAEVAFVDDWDLYHQLIGNVHCGTVVKRAVLEFDWWQRQI